MTSSPSDQRGPQVPPDAPGAGEAVCDRCAGTGKVDGKTCPVCEGTGKIIEGIGGG